MNEEEKEPMTMTVAEFGRQAEEKRRQRLARGKWGVWYLTRSRKRFGIKPPLHPHHPYEIELSVIERDGPLHWLAHLREKTWFERGDLEDLMSAFDDLFDVGWIYLGMRGKKPELSKEV